MRKVVGTIRAELSEEGMERLELNGPAPIIKAGLLAIIEQICKTEGRTSKQYIEEMRTIVAARDAIVEGHKDFFDKLKKMQKHCETTNCADCKIDHDELGEEWEKIIQEAHKGKCQLVDKENAN